MTMRAVTAIKTDREDPLSGLDVRDDYPSPTAPEGWEIVEIRAAALNHHDLWNLRGLGGIGSRLPIVLGSDGAGVLASGREVLIHAMIAPAAPRDEEAAPGTSLLSDRHDGTLAEQVAVPSANLVDKPDGLSFEEAACLPTAYLTAFRMLFAKADLRPGQRVLIQGAGGGVATAAVLLARAAGVHVTVTSRHEDKLERALQIGAQVAVPSGDRLPERVHAVLDTVGQVTWQHSLGALVDGGTLVVAGATSGAHPLTDVRQVYRRQLNIRGSMMGSREELARLTRFMVETGVRPLVFEVRDLEEAPSALADMVRGATFGKIVLQP